MMHKLLSAVLLIFLISLPAQATTLLGSSCATEEEGATACHLEGCYKCVSQVWTQQPLFVGNFSSACDSAHAGLMRFTGTGFQGCTGTVWTDFSTIDPAAEPGTAGDSYTALLLHFEGANGAATITDSSASAHVMTSSGPTISTTSYKFGGSSSLFAGSGRITTPDSTDFQFDAGDFTIDFWIKSTQSALSMPIEFPYSAAGNGWNVTYFYFNYPSSGYLYAYSGISSGSHVNITSTSTINDGTWHHVAFVRGGLTAYLFVDGVLQGSSSMNFTLSYPTGNPLNIGAGYDGGSPFVGSLDELRISKGIARWTSNFTPPTAPY